jgi:transposase-like protein
MKSSENQKHIAFLKYLCGYTPKEIAKELSIHFTTVYRWINVWKESLEGQTLSELSLQNIGSILTYIGELRAQLDALEQSMTIIHESNVLQMIPLKQRIAMAVQLSDTYPALQLCCAFEIKLSTLYYHKRIAQCGTRHQQEEDLLCIAIANAFEESEGRFGAEQIRIQLGKREIKASKKRVIRLMRKMGLYKEDSELPYYPSSDAECLEDIHNVQIL